MARKMRDSGVEWIGEVPEGWKVRKAKSIIIANDGGVWGDDPTGENDTIVLRSTEQGLDGKLYIQKPAYRHLSDAERNRYLLKSDDLIITKSSGSRDHIGKTSLIDESVSNLKCCYSNFIQRIRVVGFPRYCWYLYNNYIVKLQFDYLCTTTTGLNNLNSGIIGNVVIPIPPLPVQRRIADYLDEKCAAIDGAVDELKRGIEDCKAWKKAIIEETVFSGLRHKEFVETGDDWLTSIPSSWGFEQIRYLFALRDERNDKPLSEVNLISLYTDQGVVQHCDLEKTTGNKASTADGYKIVKENDIVVNIILCWMGAIGRSAYNGVTSPAYDVYRPVDESRVLSRYYHYLFRTSRFNGKCYQEGRGIMMMRWRTYSSEFRAIKVPVPPMKEQQAIADYLDEKCAAIDALVAEKEKLITDLEAYKKSLIFELVTGKKEVK